MNGLQWPGEKRDGQFLHANACGVVDRRRDGGGYAGQADLVDAARASPASWPAIYP
jgi:hypothetical protein